MLFATRIIRLENENRILKAAFADKQAFRGCDSEEHFLKIMSERFGVRFTALRRYLCSPDGKILFSMPGSKYRSSYENPRHSGADHAMELARQGQISIQGSFLYYSEKNIENQVTQIYVFESKELITLSPAQKKNLLAQVIMRKLSPEDVFMPIYAKKWFDETEHSIEAFEEELFYFFQKLETLFYVKKIELSFMIDAGITDFKLMNKEWHQDSKIIDMMARKKDTGISIPLRQISVIKINPLYQAVLLDPMDRNTYSFYLTTRIGEKYWGTLVFQTIFDLSQNPAIKLLLEDTVMRFSRRASGNLTVIDLRDHLGKVKDKGKILGEQAFTYELTNLPNDRAYNASLLNFFKTNETLSPNQFLAVTFLDGQYLKIKNESFGHVKTNEIIKKFSQTISRAGTVFHPHGDEFILFNLIDSVDENEKKMTQLLNQISHNPYVLETTYYELAETLRVAINYADSMNDRSAKKNKKRPIYPRAVWTKMGMRLPYYKRDPLLREIVFYLNRIQKKMNQMKFDFEKFRKIHHENLEHMKSLENYYEKEKFILEADLKLLSLEEKHDAEENIYLQRLHDFPANQLNIFQGRSEEKINIPVVLNMTGGTVYIGSKAYKEFRENAFNSDSPVNYLKFVTLNTADNVRITGRSKGKNYSYILMP